ncbi:MAG: 4-hydroxy-3-methylbut-2-enyl diphosphate reductase [Lachnospiraceae bacterium]|jgi:4-hydroxy-3-methylbut-2-en-1-yl diphosphate reductase|nr:4-hydroxy-3-methylbut-2-enyl diphosphate reductase [Lachnospiraceae bacterium]MCI1726750.1 4-hydroxy-3-methylbut-2-enyl diphosphate reductase [Lachnospiraceae bacterium]
MARVEVAKTAGFCFGVHRAVNMAYDAAENEGGPIYTLGPIIHNENVVGDLCRRGISPISDEEAVRSLRPGSTVVIRSHGIPKKLYDELKKTGAKVLDATCPYVQKIHQIVQKNSLDGRRIVIIGNPDHPEVTGIRGWAEGPCDVVQDAGDIAGISLQQNDRVCLVSQTTFNYDKFQELVEIIRKLVYDIIILNTICDATKERQQEASELAKDSDIMLVIGSRSSSNTQKLYDICKAECENTYYIQTLDDLVTVHFHSDSLVGITAGASAPNNIIQEVSQYVRGTKF